MKTHDLRLNSFTDSLIKNGLLEMDQLDTALEQSKEHDLSLISYLAHYDLTVKETNPHYEEPVIKFVETIIKHALKKHASDIHIEPFENHCRIRFRQDGILYQIAEIPNPFANRVITRLKVMARMDISERRLPQDGRFRLNTIDMRISTCPTVTGEKVSLRILDTNKIFLDIHSLGFNPYQEQLFLKTLARPQGMILVTGPTGSGKTVTLYSALRHLNSSEKNISTVEDPVEIQLAGINQVNIHPKIGLYFSTVLRTLLRQDPDVLMIGEIRDEETAKIAMQAAETGHLVLSTLHSNNTIETLTRLQTMGIEAKHFSHSLALIISQRLARKLCQYCKKPELGCNHYVAQGCNECLQGYKGRTGIYEFLPVTADLMKLILTETNLKNIEAYLKKINFLSLREAGMEKVRLSITSLAEIDRITKE